MFLANWCTVEDLMNYVYPPFGCKCPTNLWAIPKHSCCISGTVRN